MPHMACGDIVRVWCEVYVVRTDSVVIFRRVTISHNQRVIDVLSKQRKLILRDGAKCLYFLLVVEEENVSVGPVHNSEQDKQTRHDPPLFKYKTV